MTKIEDDDIELEKLKIEQEKIRLEQARLQLDENRFKEENKFRYFTFISILVPLLTIAFSIGISIWSQRKQAESDFILKAAETVIDSKSPSESDNKLKALEYLFPDQLPGNFSTTLSNFEPSDFSGGPSYDNKMNFLNLMASSGTSKDEILEMYKKLFPDSQIIEAIEK